MTVYLDYNATAPIRPEALAAMTAALAEPGNASSVHGPGRRARRLIETARAQVAALADADPTWVIFTSGGTEARSEEHTSELQSLMRNSYAVFCLKKTKYNK